MNNGFNNQQGYPQNQQNNGFGAQQGYPQNQQFNGYQQPMQGGYIASPPVPMQRPLSNKYSGAAIASVIMAALMIVCIFLPYMQASASAYGVKVYQSASLWDATFNLAKIGGALGNSSVANVFGFLLGTVVVDGGLIILLELLGKTSKGARIGALILNIIAHLIVAFYTLITFAALADIRYVDCGIGCIGMWLLSIALIVTTACSVPNKYASGYAPAAPMNYVQPNMSGQGYGNPQQNQGYPQNQQNINLNKPGNGQF